MLGVLAHGAAGRAGFEINVCRRGPVNGVDYEVLGLQVTVATVFGNCFGAYIFLGRFLGASNGVGAMFAHLMWRISNRRSGWHR